MHPWHRSAVVFATLTALTSTALAQEPPAEEPPADDAQVKKPKRGDFDAGGQVRLPNGPDEMNQFATFNWVALDVVGRYFLLDSVTVDGKVPLAIIKPDALMTGEEPSMFGGATIGLTAKLPRMPFQPSASQTEVGVVLTGAYMREGAMLLSEKDYPRFVGDFQPGFSAGAIAKLKLSSLIDVATTPVFVYQSASAGALTAVQIPASANVRLGSLLQVSADAGVFTGDDFSFGGDDGGRISAGGSVTVKLGPILAHAGAGVASLLTGGLYPSVADSAYIDLNVKYAK